MLALPGAALAHEPHVRVAVLLDSPPLVEHASAQRSASAYERSGRLDVAAFGSRLYLAQLAGEQALAVRRIRAQVPGALVGARMRVVMNALSLSVPASAVARLDRIPGVAEVLVSQRIHALTDSVPRVVGATAIWGSKGEASGQGVRIAIVDDGVDASHPFFRAAGQDPPPGWPRGQRDFTRGRVIVARAFPPPGSRGTSTLAFDPETSSHGTHVAGIAAGARGTVARPGGGLPTVHGLSGVAPAAFIGNYRALTEPDPQYGLVGGAAEIAAAIDRAVADRMQVVNLSIGGYEVEPRADPLVRAVRGAVRAGVVVVAAAGNERDLLGEGSVGSPGSAPEAITVGATTNARAFGTRLRVRARSGAPALPAALRGALVAAIGGVDLPPGATHLTRLRAVTPGGLCRQPPPGRHSGLVLLVRERGCPLEQIAANADAAGAVLLLAQIEGPGDPPRIETELSLPAVLVSDLTADTLRGYLRSSRGGVRVAVGRSVREQRGGAGVVTGFSSSGPTPFDHILKPDVVRARPDRALVRAARLARLSRALRGVRWHLDGDSGRCRRGGPGAAAPPGLAARAAACRARGDRRPRLRGYRQNAAGLAAAWRRGRRRRGAGGGPADPARPCLPVIRRGCASQSADARSNRDRRRCRRWRRRLGRRGGIAPGAAGRTRGRADLPAPGRRIVGGACGARRRGGECARRRCHRSHHAHACRRPRAACAVLAAGVAPDPRADLRCGCCRGPARMPATRDSARRARRFTATRATRPRSACRNDGAGASRSGRSGSSARRSTQVSPCRRSEVRASLRSCCARSTRTRLPGRGRCPSTSARARRRSTTPVAAAGLMAPRPGVYYVAVDSRWPRYGGRYRLRFWVDDVRPPRVDLLTPSLPATGQPVLRLRVLDAASGVDARTLSVSGPGFEELPPVSWDDRHGIASFRLPRLPVGRVEVKVEVSDLAQSKDAISARPTPRNTAKVHVSVQVG